MDFPSRPLPLPYKWKALAQAIGHLLVADLDGDGDLDIVDPESSYRGPVHVWINKLVK